MRIMNLGLMKKRNSRVLTNSANFLQKFLPRCTLLLSVVGRHNRNLTEKCSARIFPKSPSATSLNSDVKLNKFEVLKIEEGLWLKAIFINKSLIIILI